MFMEKVKKDLSPRIAQICSRNEMSISSVEKCFVGDRRIVNGPLA
jgi:hypothetical protein